MKYKGDIIETMEEHGFVTTKIGGLYEMARGDDEIGFVWWANEKISRKEGTYKSHLGVVMHTGRYRLPFTTFIEKNEKVKEIVRDWKDVKEELVNVFIASFTDEKALQELKNNSRYEIFAPAEELTDLSG